jgi:hypothetical protein
MDPVGSAQGDRPHRVLGYIVAYLEFGMVEEPDQPFPDGQRIAAGLAGSALGFFPSETGGGALRSLSATTSARLTPGSCSSGSSCKLLSFSLLGPYFSIRY